MQNTKDNFSHKINRVCIYRQSLCIQKVTSTQMQICSIRISMLVEIENKNECEKSSSIGVLEFLKIMVC